MSLVEQKKTLPLQKIIFTLFLLIALLAPTEKNFADAPFITDDPQVMDPGNWDVIPYATADKYTSLTALQAPSLEFDFSLLPHSEIDIYLPYQNNINARPAYRSGLPNASGIGDTDVEIKVNLLKETTLLPAVSFVPNFYFPTGNTNQGLGNGRTWYTLPISVEKNFDKWTTYVELGYGINNAAFAVNYLFGGWVITKKVTDNLSIGGEIYSQGTSAFFLPAYTVLNFGTTYQLNKHSSFLFSLGHGIIGPEQWTSYLGFEYSP